jgi:hypothetical protein
MLPACVLCMQDVLGHFNARVFVSHCGLHSVYEAGFHGVPVVGVPFMFEQVLFTIVPHTAHVRHQVPWRSLLCCGCTGSDSVA